MTDRSDAVIIRREPLRGPPRRDRYEPRDDGRWRRVDEVWTGCRWRAAGQEIVADVELEISPAALATVVDVIRDRVGAVTRGP